MVNAAEYRANLRGTRSGAGLGGGPDTGRDLIVPKKGTIVPIIGTMGTRAMGKLSNALFSESRQRVLGLLYGQPKSSFFQKEILRHSGMGVGTIKRELDRLHQAGILTLRKVGNQLHYQANPTCPIYTELCAIVRKTTGLVDPIVRALAPLEQEIDYAFIFGSLASGSESSGSDVDLMVVGEVSFSNVVKVLHPVEEEIGREINPKVFRNNEWEEKRNAKDSFIMNVIEHPRLNVIGQIPDKSVV